jgi:hypothetical protein
MKKIHCFVLALLALPCRVPAQEQPFTPPTEAATSSREVSLDNIVVRSPTCSFPVRYSYGTSASYGDNTGVPLSIEAVDSALPLALYYTREGDRLIVDGGLARKTTPDPAPELSGNCCGN